MSNEYTPTTEDVEVVSDSFTPSPLYVREVYAKGRKHSFTSPTYKEGLAEFDRWLASHDAEVREKVAVEIETTTPCTCEEIQRLHMKAMSGQLLKCDRCIHVEIARTKGNDIST